MANEQNKEQAVTAFWNGIREINLIQFELEIIHTKLRNLKNTIYNKIPFDPDNKETSDLKLWNPDNINVKINRTMNKDLLTKLE